MQKDRFYLPCSRNNPDNLLSCHRIHDPDQYQPVRIV